MFLLHLLLRLSLLSWTSVSYLTSRSFLSLVWKSIRQYSWSFFVTNNGGLSRICSTRSFNLVHRLLRFFLQIYFTSTTWGLVLNHGILNPSSCDNNIRLLRLNFCGVRVPGRTYSCTSIICSGWGSSVRRNLMALVYLLAVWSLLTDFFYLFLSTYFASSHNLFCTFSFMAGDFLALSIFLRFIWFLDYLVLLNLFLVS